MKRLWGNVLVILFLALWVAPVGYYGFSDGPAPWLPSWLARRTNVSRLFAREYGSLFVYEVWVKSGTEVDFHRLDERRYFRMRPFGYRTRMQRILEIAPDGAREGLIDWLREHGAGEGRLPVAFRIVRFPIGVPKSSEVDGHYVQASSAEVEKGNIQVMQEYRW